MGTKKANKNICFNVSQPTSTLVVSRNQDDGDETVVIMDIFIFKGKVAEVK